jgi:hypothetical protein
MLIETRAEQSSWLPLLEPIGYIPPAEAEANYLARATTARRVVQCDCYLRPEREIRVS